MDPLQAREGLVPDDAVAHRQVASLDQRQAQITRQIRLFVISFVVRAGRQQHNQRQFALAQRLTSVAVGRTLAPPMRQAFPQGVEKSRQVLNFHVTQQIREGAGND